MIEEPRTERERLDHLLKIISSERFLKMKGLGNEVPFFICPYKVQKSVDVEKTIHQLVNQLETSGIRVLAINLYDLCVDLLKQDDDWDWYLEREEAMRKDQLLEDMQSILDVRSAIIPAIGEQIEATEHDVLILSGVGEIFPFIRSHNILNNLQSTAKKQPTVIFFPGKYTYSPDTGASLELFDRLHDDKYYRAFNIYHVDA